MMKKLLYLFIAITLFGCKDNSEKKSEEIQTEIDSSKIVKEREYKVLDSKYINNDSLWLPFEKDLSAFTEENYNRVKPFIFDKSIPEIQDAISSGKLSYEELSLFYLHRINQFDRQNELSLNSVISINPKLLEEARAKDSEKGNNKNPIYGIPVLLKDNIDTKNMATTAGAAALKNNSTEDAYIVQRLKEQGALILGKANLSEWAYFLCEDCPSGYSAIGGQTLNPYGRKIFDTGGSSSGSAVAVAANLAPVAVGSETSGSILSPSSQNSLVGLKPTIGLLSRGGIVPISSTLDTPGPITKNVIDNAILLSAMSGKDAKDPASASVKNIVKDYYSSVENSSLKGKRFGAIKELMEDTLYAAAVADLKNAGATVIEFEAQDLDLPHFTTLLNLDMKKDLPAYLKNYGGKVNVSSVDDVIKYNLDDSLKRSPYGQALFEGIVNDSTSAKDFAAIKDTLQQNGKKFFDVPMQENQLDAVLSINNYHAGFAAVAKYPAITVPLGYKNTGEPEGLTFIAKPFMEQNLLEWAAAYEKASKKRISPQDYNN